MEGIENGGLNNGSEATKKFNSPSIEYEKNLEEKNVPYTVEVNGENLRELLQISGMSDEKISKLKVRVRKSSLFKRGSFNHINNTLTIFTDPVWDDYQKYKKLAERIARGDKEPSKNQFKDILYTKRLSNYLKNAPSERALAFAEKLISRGTTRRMAETFLHESKHAIDRTDKKLHIGRAVLSFAIHGGSAFLGFKISSSMPEVQNLLVDTYTQVAPPVVGIVFGNLLFYEVDPGEIRAKRFGKENKVDSRWSPLVKITPKN